MAWFCTRPLACASGCRRALSACWAWGGAAVHEGESPVAVLENVIRQRGIRLGKHSAAQGAGSARQPRAARGRPRLCWPCSAAKGRCGKAMEDERLWGLLEDNGGGDGVVERLGWLADLKENMEISI